MGSIRVADEEAARIEAARKMAKAFEKAAGIAMVPEVMTLQDFSDATGILPGTVRTVCADERIPAVKIGRTWVVRSREALGLPPLQINVYLGDEGSGGSAA